jgi:hypothetical protein
MPCAVCRFIFLYPNGGVFVFKFLSAIFRGSSTFERVCSIIGTLSGIKQLYIGLDGAEQEWLNVPGN